MDRSPITFLVLIITGLVTWQAFRRRELMELLIFRPERILVNKEYHRLASSALLHGDWWHFGFNAFTFLMFAPALERPPFGPYVLLLVYLSAIIGGSLLSLVIHRHDNYAALGASGGVCGVIFAATFLHPGMWVSLPFIPILVPGWISAIAFVAISFFGVRHRWGNIGHDAHLGGALVGLAVAFACYPGIVLSSSWKFWTVVALGAVALLMLVMFPHGFGGSLLVGGVKEHKSNLRYQDYDRARERIAAKERLDALLEKISRSGIDSLSASERRELDERSKLARR